MLKIDSFSRVDKMARGITRDLRVNWALEEIGMPYEIVGMDHPNHDLDSPEFRAKNPFGQLPVIDDNGVVVTAIFRAIRSFGVRPAGRRPLTFGGASPCFWRPVAMDGSTPTDSSQWTFFAEK
ncbi:glutathione S-transferase [Myxococcus sp. CA051A]|uniref:glutathione S-transferase N-terminal domain-containing protein n=1 Tax=Myxococcus sp. CA051A TaxID=2741739 RepID=UPI00157A4340|nr:glutathione S-transferase N-terminal domain-containing protein [Myxococcus sp. CA051A]NTX66229.1 glutathione S-transferase [Myxococcus sp. CA051A]